MKKQPKQTQFCSSGSHPITHNPQSCKGCSKDRLFPSLVVWVRACGNSYFMGLLQLQFLWSFNKVTEKPSAGLFPERSKGISRGCSWCCLRDTHPCRELPGMGWPPPRSHIDHFLKGWGLLSRWQASRSRRGSLQPHSKGWVPGQNRQVEISKYLQPFLGQHEGLHHGEELADSVKPRNQQLPLLPPEKMPYCATLPTENLHPFLCSSTCHVKPHSWI